MDNITDIISKQPIIRIGLIGHVDAGKSTLLGILAKLKDGELDDGNGYARSKILKYPHEKAEGRTSSITKEHTIIDQQIIEFVDLAGHEKYLKTTMTGLCGHCVDYVALLVGGNMGTTNITEEHFKIAIGLRIPIFIIVTKIDIAPEHILDKTMKSIRYIVKKYATKNIVMNLKNMEDIDKCIRQLKITKFPRIVPTFSISNKTGENLDLLKKFLSILPNKYDFKDIDGENRFWIHHIYSVLGIGTVVYGVVMSGKIKKGEKIMIGPFNGEFKTIIIKSIHNDDRKDINVLSIGKTGCLAIRALDSKNPIKKSQIKRGLVITNKPRCYYEFTARVYLYHHSTTVRAGFEAMLHCGTIRQSARFINIKLPNFTSKKTKDTSPKVLSESTSEEIKTSDLLRTGDVGIVRFRFIHHPEYLEKGMKLMIREGKTVAMGRIDILHDLKNRI